MSETGTVRGQSRARALYLERQGLKRYAGATARPSASGRPLPR